MLGGGRRRFRCTGGAPIWSSVDCSPCRTARSACTRPAGAAAWRTSRGSRAPGAARRLVARRRARRFAGSGRRHGANPRTLVGKLVTGSRRLLQSCVEFTLDGRSLAYDAACTGPRLVSVTGRAQHGTPGIRQLVARRRAVRVRGRQERRYTGAGGRPARRRVAAVAFYRQGLGRGHPLGTGRSQGAARATRTTTTSCTRSSGTAAGLRALTDDGSRSRSCLVTRRQHARVHLGRYAGSDCKACALALHSALADGTRRRPSRATARASPQRRGLEPTGRRSPSCAGRDWANCTRSTRTAAHSPRWRPPPRDCTRLVPGRAHARLRLADGLRGRDPRDRGRRRPGATEVTTPSGEMTADLRDPAWSPDGASLAFTGRHGLYVATAGRPAVRVTTALGPATLRGHPRAAARVRRALHQLHDRERAHARP